MKYFHKSVDRVGAEYSDSRILGSITRTRREQGWGATDASSRARRRKGFLIEKAIIVLGQAAGAGDAAVVVARQSRGARPGGAAIVDFEQAEALPGRDNHQEITADQAHGPHSVKWESP